MSQVRMYGTNYTQFPLAQSAETVEYTDCISFCLFFLFSSFFFFLSFFFFFRFFFLFHFFSFLLLSFFFFFLSSFLFRFSFFIDFFNFFFLFNIFIFSFIFFLFFFFLSFFFFTVLVDGFILRHYKLSKIQTAPSLIWTGIAQSISYDNNYYSSNASKYIYVGFCLSIRA